MAGFFNIIILLGSVQGFIVGSLLFFSSSNLRSNRILAILIFLFSIASLKVFLNTQIWFESSQVLQVISAFLPFFVIMPIGPLIFFYVRSSLDPGFRMTKKNRAHFYTIILDLVPQLTALFYVAGLSLGFLKQTDQPALGRFIDGYNVYSDIPRWISFSIYLWFSARNISSAAGKNIVPESGQLKTMRARWLKQFVRVFLIFQVIWLLFLIPYTIPAYTDKLLNSVGWYPIFLPLSVLIYWLGIKGYGFSQKDQASSRKAGIAASPLSPVLIQQAVSSLKKAMEEDRLYLDPNLNLLRLSQKTGIAAKTISSVLNQFLGKSFNEFINEYRVAEIKKRLLKPENKGITIAGLAYECGFNSQPTFQRAFKSMIGQTPKEFLLMNS